MSEIITIFFWNSPMSEATLFELFLLSEILGNASLNFYLRKDNDNILYVRSWTCRKYAEVIRTFK